MIPISPDLDRVIRTVLRECGHQIEQMSSQGLEVSQKGPEDYVTSVDLALNQRLSAAFSTHFPKDGLITEENVHSKQAYTAGHTRIWCIDPLDGTEDFIHGKWQYAVMIGLLQNQQPIAGWIYAPAYDQIYCGGQDWGLFQAIGDHPLMPIPLVEPPPPRNGFCPVIIGHRDQTRFGAAIAEQIPGVQFYSLGSFGLKVMEVILGRAGLYLYFNGRVKIWDTCGPLALARTAGLVCCDLDGQPIGFAPEQFDLETLAHKQPILVGWPHYVDLLRPKLKAVASEVAQIYR